MEAKKILEQSINDHQDAIDEAKKELAELDKSKLGHGEKVVRIDSNKDRIVLYNNRGELVIFAEDGTEQYPVPNTNLYRGSGETIFDDIKRNSEELTGFKVHTNCYSKGNIEMETVEKGINFKINSPSDSKSFTLDETIKFHQQLGQLIATAKRKQ